MVRLSKEETILLGACFALTLTWLAKPLQLTGQSLKLANPIDTTLKLRFESSPVSGRLKINKRFNINVFWSQRQVLGSALKNCVLICMYV